MKNFVIIALATAFVSGCSVTKNMDEMNGKMSKMLDKLDDTNKNTQDMKKTTEELGKKTGEVNETSKYLDQKTGSLLDETTHMSITTDKLLGITTELVPKVRPAILSNLRDASFEVLRSVKSDLVDTKFIYASKFFMAEEFQHWDHRYEGTADREKFMGQAISEFFGYVRRFVVHGRPLLPLFPDNELNSLYAIVATLHTVHEDQVVLKGPGGPGGQPLLSMKSIIQDGLNEVVRARRETPNFLEKCYLGENEIQKPKRQNQQSQEVVESKKDPLPKFICVVGENEQLAIYLMQLRYNFLAGVALANATKLNLDGTSNIFDAVWSGAADLLTKGKMLVGEWSPDVLVSKNIFQVTYLNEVLDEALKTKAFLQSIGAPVPFEGMAATVIRNMKYPAIPDSYTMEHKAALNRYYGLLKSILN